ncbi:MAG TPA: methionine--tRNA ligase [Alphaproteobacteria bacterium]|nr:methionine--tRNA ligase [Alphaproteobacteria bacterium]
MTTRYITTPIFYLNGEPHLGHVYTTVAGDMLARYWRLAGARVKFLTGTDEHGQKVAQAAEAADEGPQVYTNRMSALWLDMTRKINASQDVFLRTTEKRHHEAAQALWRKLEEAGQIYKSVYAGWYSVRDEAYYEESEIVDGLAPTGAPVEWMEETSYFFRLSAWERPLLDYYEANPQAIAPIGKRKEVLSFIKGGLRDLSISRTKFTWGVTVPEDPEHVMYVWVEALVNYITALGYPNVEGEEFQAFWPEVIHIIGKDIIRFHAVYWPALLLAAGLLPPNRIFAHGWWTHDGEKMSKSLGNVVDPFKLIDTYGLDPVRYYLMREIPFGQDGDYSDESMIQRVNSDLANDLGNLVQRVLSFIYKNAGAQIPKPDELLGEDREMLAKAAHLHDLLRDDMEVQALQAYCQHIWEVVGEANRYVDSQKPWSLKKSLDPQDHRRMETVLYVLAEVIRHVAIYVQPIMPEAASKILDQMGQEERTFEALKSPLKPGTPIVEPQAVFPRVEKEK